MARTREELTNAFSDGALPTGEDFAALIDSFTLRSELLAHEARMLPLLQKGSMTIGEAENGWTIERDEAGNLSFKRVLTAPTGKDASAVFSGYLRAEGIQGGALDKAAYEAKESPIAPPPSSIASTGEFETILNAPARPAALEIVACAQPAEAPRKRTWWQFALGIDPVGATLLRATALNSAFRQPTLQQEAAPKKRWRTRMALHLAISAILLSIAIFSIFLLTRDTTAAAEPVICTQLGKKFLNDACLSMHKNSILFTSASIILLIFFASRSCFAFGAQTKIARIRWEKAGDGYVLQLSGPKYPGPAVPLYYHVTRRWG